MQLSYIKFYDSNQTYKVSFIHNLQEFGDVSIIYT